MSIKEDLDALKQRFVSGNIPTENDFTKLIESVKNANAFLNYGTLSPNPTKGLVVENDSFGIELSKTSGLILQNDELALKAGDGILANKDGVSINVDNGLAIDAKTLKVLTDDGITTETDGLKINVGNGIGIPNNTLSIELGQGIDIDVNNKLSVKLSPNEKDSMGLKRTNDGLALKISPDQDNNLEITNGQLTLKKPAIDKLITASTKKFKTAFEKAQEQKNAIDKPIFEKKLDSESDWKTSIEHLITGANDFGEKRIERARKYFHTEGIKKLLEGYTIDPNDVHFNFSRDFTNLFLGEKFSFYLYCLIWIDDNGEKNVPIVSDGTVVDYNKILKKNRFYVFLGKIDENGDCRYDSTKLTSNAVMVYIAETTVYVIGYWKINEARDTFTWYLGEIDLYNNFRFEKAILKSHDDISLSDNGNIIIDPAKLGVKEPWDTPLTTLVKAANSYGQGELQRARDSLPQFLTDLNKFTKVKYDRPAINFSVTSDSKHWLYSTFLVGSSSSFFSCHKTYTYHYAVGKWSEITYSDTIAASVEYFSEPPKVGYFASIGKLSDKNDTSESGMFHTCNAIMYHIDAHKLVSVVGYFDLTFSTPVFYTVEADPLNNAKKLQTP